jgi:hypothetical protein
LFADELKVKAESRVLPVWMIGILGVFVPVLKEFKEMIYQFDRDFFFNSSKFTKRFGEQATSPRDAVRWIVRNVKF